MEVAVIKDIYGQLTGSEISDEGVRAEIIEAETRTGSVTDSLRELSGGLNGAGKEMVIKAAFLVAAADGVFQDEEMALIGEIANALEMSKAHVNGVIADLQTQT